jgi:phosphoenolpyruvate carboxylase
MSTTTIDQLMQSIDTNLANINKIKEKIEQHPMFQNNDDTLDLRTLNFNNYLSQIDQYLNKIEVVSQLMLKQLHD